MLLSLMLVLRLELVFLMKRGNWCEVISVSNKIIIPLGRLRSVLDGSGI